MTEITASFQKSRVKTSLKHDQRTSKDKGLLENKGKHIDWSKTDENLHLRDCESLRKTFNNVFKESVDTYNSTQKRKDRRISDYYSKALGNSRLTPTQEFVVQLGDKNTGFKEDPKENRAEWGKLYKTYLDSFEERNPNLRVASATVHFDEKGGPHMHMVTIPVGTYSRGMKKRANFDRAMGWNEKKKDFDNFRDFQAWKKDQFANWADNEREQLLECAREMGYDASRKKQAKQHEHLEPQEYRELQAKLDTIKQNVYTENENLYALQKNKNALSIEVSQLKQKKDGYTKDIQYLQNEADTEKQNVDTIKKQKDEASENLRQLQAEVQRLQKEKHEAQEAVNKAYADRKKKYLETSSAWGEYREQMCQLKEDRWNLWNDPTSCELFKQRCRELRETNRALYAWRGGGIIAHTVHFILKLKQLSKEKQLQELKDEQARAMQELQQRSKELAQQRKDLLKQSKDANDAIATAKALRAETNTALKQVKADLHESQKYVNFAQQVKQEVAQGKVKPSDAVKQLDAKKPQQRVDENKLNTKQDKLNIDLAGLDDDRRQQL
mgnify:CR=1 FL=1